MTTEPEYPIEWQRQTYDDARSYVDTFGLLPDELTRLDEQDSIVSSVNEGDSTVSITLRQAGFVQMACYIGPYFGRWHPGIYVHDVKNGESFRWFNNRKSAAEYFETLVAANA